MDKDEFRAWKDSPATMWVMRWLAEEAARVEAESKALLFDAAYLTAAQWADLQGRVGHSRGYVEAIRGVLALEHSEISEEDEKIEA